MPATDTIDFEHEFEGLVRDLRALPTAASEHVRGEVRALGEPSQPPRLWDRLVAFPWRRSLLVLAPACALGLVSAAVIHGVLNSGTKSAAVATVQEGEAVHGASGGAGQRKNPALGLDDSATTPTTPFDSGIPAPNPSRYQDYEAWMTLRVGDVTALTERTNEAMRVVRDAGGYVASVEQATSAGQPGRADLVLRVPVGRVQDALVRLSALGTVIERHLSIRDLEQVVQQQRARILKLKVFIARATEQLQGTLPADVRLRLQLQLDEAKSQLARATSSSKATLRDATLSHVSLTFTTEKAVGATKKGGAGRIERTARDAASFLAAAGAILLFILIVLSPLIVLAVAATFAARAYRRREERRLLSAV
jgi:Domain of unknown function (DUF4349)